MIGRILLRRSTSTKPAMYSGVSGNTSSTGSPMAVFPYNYQGILALFTKIVRKAIFEPEKQPQPQTPACGIVDNRPQKSHVHAAPAANFNVHPAQLLLEPDRILFLNISAGRCGGLSLGLFFFICSYTCFYTCRSIPAVRNPTSQALHQTHQPLQPFHQHRFGPTIDDDCR